jgi:outer membrane lipoprotein SlyB
MKRPHHLAATQGGSATIHPLVGIAAVTVAAVSLIAGAQLLMPRDAASHGDVAAPAATAPAVSKPRVVASAPCRDCGVVQSVREVKQQGEGTGAGAVAGGVIGGVLGHQVGGGRGKDVATAVGVVGGAVAGHHIEKNARATTVYHVEVRMDDGTLRKLTLNAPPAVAVGAKVRVNGNELQQRG